MPLVREDRRVYLEASRDSFISQSALVKAFKAVREHGLPEHISRPTLKRTRVSELASQTPVGPLWGTMKLELDNKATLSVPVVMPMALLQTCLLRSPCYAE